MYRVVCNRQSAQGLQHVQRNLAPASPAVSAVTVCHPDRCPALHNILDQKSRLHKDSLARAQRQHVAALCCHHGHQDPATPCIARNLAAMQSAHVFSTALASAYLALAAPRRRYPVLAAAEQHGEADASDHDPVHRRAQAQSLQAESQLKHLQQQIVVQAATSLRRHAAMSPRRLKAGATRHATVCPWTGSYCATI